MRKFKTTLIFILSSLVVFVPTDKPIISHPATINGIKAHAIAPSLIQAPASVFAPKPTKTVTPPVQAIQSAPKGSCADWMAQAGIPLTPATQKLVLNESGCRTNAINPSSGACGIPQAWPCAKLKCPLNDSGAVCQLKWMDKYVKDVYGTWDSALSKWYSRCGSKQGCWY